MAVLGRLTGPIPERSETRTRRNAPIIPIDKASIQGEVEIPDLGIPGAHNLVVDLYNSMKISAQSDYYEPTDWQFARLTLSVLNDYLKDSGPISAMKLSAVNQMLTSLLLTEGDRRRVRIEVERNKAGGVVIDVAAMFEAKMAEG